MDKSQDGTQPVEAEDATQALHAPEPQDVPPTTPSAQSAPREADAPERPAPVPEIAAPAPDRTGYAAPVTSAAPSTPVAVTAPDRPRGPNAAAILLGAIALAVAVLAILRETTDVTINWSAIGPGAVIAAGLLMLVVGVVGLTQRERRER